jgi:superfamily II DNA or RNA helicase
MSTRSNLTWQNEAIQLVVNEWREGHLKKLLVAACTGSGKTFAGVSAADIALRDADIAVIVVLTPTVNIKLGWKEQFETFNIKVCDEAKNRWLRRRRDDGDNMIENYGAIIITYAQLAEEPELFEEMARRHPMLLMGDEIHHADDNADYGEAVERVADAAKMTLAFSGTPFNTRGGSLALCESEEDIDDEGNQIRCSTPTFSFSYQHALAIDPVVGRPVCRKVEFVTVIGKGEVEYRSLANNETFKRVTDLAKQNKTDRLFHLLDVDGEFMVESARTALKALADLRKEGDRRAAMLVCAMDRKHGARVAGLLQRLCDSNPDWERFRIQEIYNDTVAAHQRIEQLKIDRTDIVVSVRMISEGIDVHRFRVGWYATNTLTPMFFKQFVGRFVRWDEQLGMSQYAVAIIPAHVELMKFAREIERMVVAAEIDEMGDGDGEGGERMPKNEFVSAVSMATGMQMIAHGKQYTEIDVAKGEILKQRIDPDIAHEVSPALAAELARLFLTDDVVPTGIKETPFKVKKPDEDYREKNRKLVGRIVRHMRDETGEKDDILFSRVNGQANDAVGVKYVDDMTPPEIWERRHVWLKQHYQMLLGQYDLENVEP